MIVNGHNYCWRDSLSPGVIAKGFSQGMAADRPLNVKLAGSIFDNAECLYATDWTIADLPAPKYVVLACYGRLGIF